MSSTTISQACRATIHVSDKITLVDALICQAEAATRDYSTRIPSLPGSHNQDSSTRPVNIGRIIDEALALLEEEDEDAMGFGWGDESRRGVAFPVGQ